MNYDADNTVIICAYVLANSKYIVRVAACPNDHVSSHHQSE